MQLHLNYAELIQKDKFSKLSKEQLYEELSLITGIIEDIPTAEQYDNIHTNRNRILEALAAPVSREEELNKEFYLVESPRFETAGTRVYGAFTLKDAQALMAKLAIADDVEDVEPQDFDNWNLDTPNYLLSIVALSENNP